MMHRLECMGEYHVPCCQHRTIAGERGKGNGEKQEQGKCSIQRAASPVLLEKVWSLRKQAAQRRMHILR